MAQQTLETTDNLNVGRGKINDNFTELYTGAFVPLTLTGDTTIATGGFSLILEGTGVQIPNISLDAPNNVRKALTYRTAGLSRWEVHIEDTESGSNAGANFHIERFDDAGVFIDAPLTINRNNGVAVFTNSPSSPANTTSERFGAGAILSTFAESSVFGNTATSGFRASVVMGYNAFSIASEYDFNPSSFGGAPTIIGTEASGQGTSIGYQSFTGDRENIAIGPKTQAEGTGSGVGAPALIAIGDGTRAMPTGAAGNQIVMGDAAYTKGNINFFIGGGAGLDHDRCICYGCQGSSTAYTLSASTAAQQGFFGWYSNAGGAFPSGFVNTWFWGAIAAAEAQNISFNITSKTGTNQNGMTWTFNGSAGTGTGTPGVILFAPSVTGSSGSTQHTWQTRFRIDGLGANVNPTSNQNNLHFGLSNFGNDATTGNSLLGYNVQINASGSLVRHNTGATAIGLLFANAFGENRFRSLFITSGGTATQPHSWESTGTINIISGGQFSFSSSATVSTTAGDVGIKRTAAGSLQITNGTTGLGKLNTLFLNAGTTAAATAPLKFTSGTNMATAEAGAMEYNGADLFFTKSGTTRGTVLVSTAVATEALVSDTTLTITHAGVTYKLLAVA